MNKEEIEDKVKSLIEDKDSENVKELLNGLHPADIAELCNDLDTEDARFIYLLLDNETAADVLIEMDEDARKRFLDLLPSETIAKKFVDYMDTDDAVDIIREMDEEKQEEILSHIEDIEQAGDIVDLLKYDENTAGGLMGTEMVVVNENWSMPECLKEMRLQAEEMDETYYVSAVDDDERLRGVFPLKKMITSPSVSKVQHVMKKDPISAHVDTKIEEVVQLIEKYDLVAVPVVDSIGRLVGRITVDDVMDEVREKAEKDYQLASGLSQDVETDDSLMRQTTARLPWLLIGMIGGIGNSMILGNFDSTFAMHPEMSLAFHPVGNDRHPQLVAHGDDRAADRCLAVAHRCGLDEAAVDLELVHRIAHQRAQAGVAGAEVVQAQADAFGAQLAQGGVDKGNVVGQRAFVDFQGQRLRRHPGHLQGA